MNFIFANAFIFARNDGKKVNFTVINQSIKLKKIKHYVTKKIIKINE